MLFSRILHPSFEKIRFFCENLRQKFERYSVVFKNQSKNNSESLQKNLSTRNEMQNLFYFVQKKMFEQKMILETIMHLKRLNEKVYEDVRKMH